jgi:hypothetical protein
VTFTVENSILKVCATSVIKKLPKEKIRPMGESWPNPVTLVATILFCWLSRQWPRLRNHVFPALPWLTGFENLDRPH